MSDEEESVSAQRVCEIINEAAEDAIKTNDYISYATVLDVHLSEPERYSVEDRVEILKELYTVLSKHEQIIKEIGWDLPALLLPYYNTKLSRALLKAPAVKELAALFNLLSTKGNPKELYLKSLESLATLEFTADSPEEEGTLPRERTFGLQFVAVFQLMSYSLSRIDAQYPSRFLATSTSGLLSFLALNMDEFTPQILAVVLRRLFIFARDFQMAEPKKQPVSETELVATQKLLRSYVTWVIDLTFQRFSIRWAHRLYLEIKAKCETESSSARRQNYFQDEDVQGISECVDRFAQLAGSFDIYLEDEFMNLVTEKQEAQDQDQDEEKKPFEGLSNDGIFLLYTETKFEDRTRGIELSLDQLIKVATRFLSRDDGALAPYGILDAVIFWSLWTTRNVTREQVEALDKVELFNYLHLMSAVTVTADRETAGIVNTVVAKLLALSRENVAFEFIVDTLESCPFENVRDSTVHMLKNFAIRTRPGYSSNDTQKPEAANELADKLEKVDLNKKDEHANCPIIHLAKESSKMKTVCDLIMADVKKLQSSGIVSEGFPVVLSWINFLTVVATEKDYISGFVDECNKVDTTGNDKDTVQRKDLMNIALERLEKRWAAKE